jgi:hypothetical protein
VSDDKKPPPQKPFPRRSHFFDINPPRPPLTQLPDSANYPPRPPQLADQIAAAILAREETPRARRAADEAARPPPPQLAPPDAVDAKPSSTSKPPVPERDPAWDNVVKPGIEKHFEDGGAQFSNRAALVEWVIDDLKVERSKATIIRWVTPYDGKWFTLNGPRRKRKVASGPDAPLRR